MDRHTQAYELAKAFTPPKLEMLLRQIAPSYRPERNSLDHFVNDGWPISNVEQLGVIEFDDARTVLVSTARVTRELTSRSGRRQQYELAKKLLKAHNHNASIFAFYDEEGRFRLSLVTATYHGTRRKFSSFRRYTFFVDPDLPNKTFLLQLRRASFTSFEKLLETFSTESVTDAFYDEFKEHFANLAAAVSGDIEPPGEQTQKDFALLFAIRTIFIGFVQKKGWLADNPRFLLDFWEEYRKSQKPKDTFYKEWLAPLFFEALNSPPGQKVAHGHAPFTEKTQAALQMAPYLNGELFKRKPGLDDTAYWIADEAIGKFFEFLFQYNFTVEENERYDEELEVNPEFLGIIFERINNMDQGAVYTPRVEVDLMSRLSLVKWLERTTKLEQARLYRLFFRDEDEESGAPELSADEVRTLIEKLEGVTVCDPAAGSGAFEVGMLQVLEQVLDTLYTHPAAPHELKANRPDPYQLKKNIIANTLYGVEVKPWAVWINHLRLWLTLFVDMPESERNSFNPLLPNLTFKVRVGDSLVQRVADKTFPVQGHADLPPQVKRKITELKKKKRDFFYNEKQDPRLIEQEELNVFRVILDAEIEKRIKEIQKLQRPVPKTPVVFEELAESEAAREAAEREKREKRITQLQAEIADLEAQKRGLKADRPFIWSIEFAEVFFDRGGFDIIIGNPPYVRQEEITDPGGHLSPREYKDALLEMVRLDFPDYFAKSRAKAHEFRKDRKPSGRSDLYTYFYIRSLRLLNPKGMHVFICSNSWLDVGYGAWLQEFFLRKAPLHLVIDNHAKRSFARADVNTIITVASAPLPRGEVPKEHTVRFVAFKKPFEEAVNAENLITIEAAQKTLKTPDFRVFPITVGELLEEGSEITKLGPGKYEGDKWGGKYLRAPDIFFTILEKGKGKLVKLGEIAEVRFGIKTGANDFFYLEPLGPCSQPGLMRVRNGAGWEGEIEEEFLKPVIKSPREVRTIVIRPEDLKYRIFMCHKSKNELKGTKALEYIEWGENVEVEIKQGTKKGTKVKGFHNLPSVKGRERWWNVGRRLPGAVFWPYILRERLFAPINYTRSAFADNNLFDVYPKESGDSSISLFLNSVVHFLQVEVLSRAYGGGGGPIKTQVYELKQMKALKLNAYKVTSPPFDFEVQAIFAQCGIDPESDVPISEQEPNPLLDRKALDDIVFDALGLTEEERKEVYRAVCQLVSERISKARSIRI